MLLTIDADEEGGDVHHLLAHPAFKTNGLFAARTDNMLESPGRLAGAKGDPKEPHAGKSGSQPKQESPSLITGAKGDPKGPHAE